MKVEYVQSKSFSTNLNFKAKNIKPILKSEIPDNIKNRLEHSDKKPFIEKIMAMGISLIAFIKGPKDNKTKDDIKSEDEIDDISKRTKKIKQEIEDLKVQQRIIELEMEKVLNNKNTDDTFVYEALFRPSQSDIDGYSEFEEVHDSSEYKKYVSPDINPNEEPQEKAPTPIMSGESKNDNATEAVVTEPLKVVSDGEFEKKVKEFQADYVEKMQGLAKDMEGLKGIKNISNMYELLSRIDEMKGFDRIQGYNDIKNFFNENYIKLVKNGDERNIPNVILMYGPQGSGKTLFAQELAHESGANLIKQNVEFDIKNNIDNLMSILNKSADEYKASGKRTIIQIDELDAFNINDKESENVFKELLNDISEKYHATIVATTNAPQYVDKNILSADKFKSLYIPPAREKDIAEILEFIGQYIAEPTVDYNAAAKQILIKAGNDYYSSARIYKFIYDLAAKHKEFSQKISQQDMTNAINNDLPNADITKSDLELYNNPFKKPEEKVITDDFGQRVAQFTKDYQQKINDLKEDMDKVQDAKKLSDISDLETALSTSIKGFERICGYGQIKQYFTEKLINPVKNKDTKAIPNVILMYGAQGTGKSLFAKELFYELDAKKASLGFVISDKDYYDALLKAANQAKLDYELTGQSTIIQIDEFDTLFFEDEEIKTKFRKLLSELSQKYHAFVLATTNNINSVDRNIMGIPKLEKLYMPPATKSDIVDIVKYSLQYVADSSVNYESLAELILKKAGKDAYSNARIHKFMISVIKNQKDLSNKISQEKLENIIEEQMPLPDISKTVLEKYENII